MFCYGFCVDHSLQPSKQKSSQPSRVILDFSRTKEYQLTPMCQVDSFMQYKFTSNIHGNISYPWLDIFSYLIPHPLFLSTNIPLIYIKHKFPPNNDKTPTIIFSHDFTQNIGTVFPLLTDIASQLKCNVISYDYSEPFLSNNDSSSIEISLINDLEQVIIFSTLNFNISLKSLVLMSHSHGSIATIGICLKKMYLSVIKGIVLVSPIALKYELQYNNLIEKYNCIKKANDLSIHTFIIHGMKDKVVNVEHGKKLSKEIRNSISWFPSNGTHNILKRSKYREKLYRNLKKFINKNDSAIGNQSRFYLNDGSTRDTISCIQSNTKLSKESNNNININNNCNSKINNNDNLHDYLLSINDDVYDDIEKSFDFKI